MSAQRVRLVEDDDASQPIVRGITARAATGAVVTEDGEHTVVARQFTNFLLCAGRAFAWGCDTCGQLGVGAGDAEIVATPREVRSKHLEGLRILQVMKFLSY